MTARMGDADPSAAYSAWDNARRRPNGGLTAGERQDTRSPDRFSAYPDRDSHEPAAPMTDDDIYWDAFPEVLSTNDLSQILSVGRPGIFTRLTKGIIPAYRLERSWIIFKPEVRAWLDANSNRPQPEPNGPVDVLADYAEEMSHRDLMRLFDKSKPTIYRWMELGVIPAFHVGGRWLVRKSQLRQALHDSSNQNVKPSE